MFKDDIDLVSEMIEKYGLRYPFVDLGGLHAKDITVADYNLTIQSGVQNARYLHLSEDPFEQVAGGSYEVLNPQYGDWPIEELPRHTHKRYGTIVCLSVLEHVTNPFEVFRGLAELLKADGLLILSTVFSFPEHDIDYWRFTPRALKILAYQAGLETLEAGWRLNIHGGMGIKEIHTGVPQEIKSVYIVARKAGPPENNY